MNEIMKFGAMMIRGLAVDGRSSPRRGAECRGTHNRRRKAVGKPTCKEARFLSPRQLESILAPYGETRVVSAALVPQAGWLLALAPVTDAIGRLFHLPYGAFAVGRVKV